MNENDQKRLFLVNAADDITPEINSFQNEFRRCPFSFRNFTHSTGNSIESTQSQIFHLGKYSCVNHSIADSLGIFSMWIVLEYQCQSFKMGQTSIEITQKR